MFFLVRTFRNARELHEVATLVPDDRLLIETDSPYLAPVPFRGKRNEPAWCAYTLQRLAEVRAQDPHALGAAVLGNTRRLFALD